MENLMFLCKSANEKSVCYNPDTSHTATHFKDTPALRDVAIELIKTLTLDNEKITRDFDMGRIVGNSDVVTTDETDEIVYAMRSQREDQGYVPFTKSRSTEPTRLISLYLVQLSDQEYELSSAWFGEYESPMFPQMDNATKDSIPYWRRHAFVWGSQAIIPKTERYDCPW